MRGRRAVRRIVRGPAGAPVYDPAVLSLTGWWRADYSASPWVGTASAGASGSRDLTEATNTPAAGAAVNGFTPADYDGTNDTLANATAISNFVSANAGSLVCLFNADTAVADSLATTYYILPALITDSADGFLSMAFAAGGVRFGSWNGANFDSFTVAASTAAWHLAQARWDNTTLELRVDSGAWSSLARTITLSGSGPRVGANYNVSAVLDGKILEAMTADSRFADATFDSLIEYVNDRYGLSL